MRPLRIKELLFCGVVFYAAIVILLTLYLQTYGWWGAAKIAGASLLVWGLIRLWRLMK